MRSNSFVICIMLIRFRHTALDVVVDRKGARTSPKTYDFAVDRDVSPVNVVAELDALARHFATE